MRFSPYLFVASCLFSYSPAYSDAPCSNQTVVLHSTQSETCPPDDPEGRDRKLAKADCKKKCEAQKNCIYDGMSDVPGCVPGVNGKSALLTWNCLCVPRISTAEEQPSGDF